MVRGPLSKRIYKRFHARVVADGDRWACEDFITVAAAVVEQIGLGFKPFYRCNEQPGSFAVLGIHTTAFDFVSDLPRILSGKPMRRNPVPLRKQLRHKLLSRFRAHGLLGKSGSGELWLGLGKAKRLGFNLIIYDGDKPGAAVGENINKSRIAWSPRSGVQGRPEDWGRIDLE